MEARRLTLRRSSVAALQSADFRIAQDVMRKAAISVEDRKATNEMSKRLKHGMRKGAREGRRRSEQLQSSLRSPPAASRSQDAQTAAQRRKARRKSDLPCSGMRKLMRAANEAAAGHEYQEGEAGKAIARVAERREQRKLLRHEKEKEALAVRTRMGGASRQQVQRSMWPQFAPSTIATSDSPWHREDTEDDKLRRKAQRRKRRADEQFEAEQRAEENNTARAMRAAGCGSCVIC